MEQGDPAVKVEQEDATSDVGSGVDHLPVKTERAETWPVKTERADTSYVSPVVDHLPVKSERADTWPVKTERADTWPVKSERAETWPVKLEVDIADTPIQCWPKIPSDSQGEYTNKITQGDNPTFSHI